MTTLAGFLELSVEEQEARGLRFTPQEIAQQPDTWEATARLFRENQGRICEFLDSVGVRSGVEAKPVVLLVGAGTSDYIGRSLSLLLRRTWGCEVSACASTELLPNLEDMIVPGRKYLWVSFSRSGDSPEGVAVIEQAVRLYPEIAHLVVTCHAEAAMISVAKKADRSCVLVLDDAVNDRSLAMTSSFTNMVVVGQCLAHAWSFDEYERVMERLARAGREMLVSAGKEAERLASKGYGRICLVGTGALAGVAKESALKVLEMTAGQVKTIPETVLGLRHGPMAALDSGTLFVCFVSQDGRRARYAGDLLREIGAKGVAAERIAVGPASMREEFRGCCESYLAVPDEIGDGYRPVVDVIFGQLLGLFNSVAHGLKPDAPSPGGVISRVVQEFRIY
ncbi:Galactosamine-6-phosphate isomerase [Granulicella sibirica]|uniref:Galactosamine-6-phosphate isomerase n=2 Tax=Granulicella sibirica TaxID=2479048 RepID=A0A4Q0SZF5_9BACT|nr:Galactosamine-6-phosphate isomerase [Granulicella sibirica]